MSKFLKIKKQRYMIKIYDKEKKIVMKKENEKNLWDGIKNK